MEVTLHKADISTEIQLEFIVSGVCAGFPSPADDYLEEYMDLNKELIHNPPSTFFAKVRGNSMIDEGIRPKDILIIDKSLEPRNGSLAVCFIDGEFTLKRIQKQSNCVYLMPANKEFKPIKVTEDSSFEVWGIVTYIIKKA